MWATHDPSPATGAVGALGPRLSGNPRILLPNYSSQPAPRETTPSRETAPLYRAPPAGVNNPRLWRLPLIPLWPLRAWPCRLSPSPAEPPP